MKTMVLVLITAFALVLPAEAAGAGDAAAEAAVQAAAATAQLTDGVGLELVASLGLSADIAAPPGDDRLFVAELKAGRIRIVKNGSVLATPFLDISTLVQTASNEQGLLGIAFPSDYAETGLFYVHYSSKTGNGDTAVAEYSVSGNPDLADAGSARILFTLDQPFGNHNGGAIHIGPDGYLYIGLGDGGGGGDPGENGQNKSTLLGSILRIDPATGDAAPGNPFIGKAGADEIWLYGLRNPWRFSFDAANGDMYIGDVGQGAREEVDYIPAGVSGLNLGWDVYEGSNCYEGPCDPAGLTFPVHEYSHRAGPICGNPGGSITGGYVYRGNELPWMRGHYFYADWCLGDLSSFRVNAAGNAVEHIDWTESLSVPSVITSFGVDGFGELYFTSGGRIYKFVNERNPQCDFGGDGYADVAVGVPGEGHTGTADAGIVMQFPGSGSGVEVTAYTSFRKGAGGIAGIAGSDQFGNAVECGDFNGDGYGDLAVGGWLSEEVHILYGSSGGLRGAGSDRWTQDSLGVGTTRTGDAFGSDLAAGDINRDGYDDLLVGAFDDCETGEGCAGSVTAIYGTSSGLSGAGAQLVTQDSPGIRGDAAGGDSFGWSVAVGDIDGDGFGDAVVGVPGEDVNGKSAAGAVAVIFGNSLGLGGRDTLINRESPGIKKRSSDDGGFGSEVAVGSFDNDGFDDIAVGVSLPSLAGQAHVVYGTAGGLSRRDVVFAQGMGGLSGSREAGDGFASVLAVGDANGDGFDDLAIGVPGENLRGVVDGGIVGVLPGSVSGLDPAGYRVWHKDKRGIRGDIVAQDLFGQALRFVDTRGDGGFDLVIGAPRIGAGGSVSLIPGKAGGLSAGGDQLWSQDTPGVGGTAEPNDRFGAAL